MVPVATIGAGVGGNRNMHMTRCKLLFMVVLMGIGTRLGAEIPEADINQLTKAYSAQRIIGLNVNETFTFHLKNGAERVIKLIPVQEHRDSVINFMSRAEVRVEIDGKPLDLVCEPYTMPVEIAGIRLLADTTSGWGNVTKQAQLSLWDAADPIVNTKLFGFHLRNFRFLSHGTQNYDETVHLGAGDGDPTGQKFYHDYGLDMAGYEGVEEVVSATEGKVAMFWPSRDDLCSVVIQDPAGFHWEYAHLKAVEPEIVLDAHVARAKRSVSSEKPVRLAISHIYIWVPI